MPVVWCQQWEESERGWGTRPEGYTLHLSPEDAAKWSKHYMDEQDKYFKSHGGHGVPDEYTRPAGQPYKVEVTEEQVAALLTAKKEHGTGMHPRPWPKAVDPNSPVWRTEELPKPQNGDRTLAIPLAPEAYEDFVRVAKEVGKEPEVLARQLLTDFMGIVQRPKTGKRAKSN